MAQTIKLKRSNTSGAVPTTSQLSVGELALNTRDGKIYMRKYVDGTTGNDTITLIGDTSTIAATTLTGNLSMGDNVRAIFGTGNDLQIYHDGSNSYINENGTGDLIIKGGGTLRLQGSASTELANFSTGAGVTLFHNNVSKFATTSYGADITGRLVTTSHIDAPDDARIRLGDGDDLQFYHDGSNSYIQHGTTGNFNFTLKGGTEFALIAANDGPVTLYHNNVSKFATQSYGALVSGVLLANNGSAAAPAFSFSNDSDTGMYRNSADIVAFATGGARRGYWASSGLHSDSNVYTGSGGTFRNYAGVWSATTGTTGNGFSFVNSVDGTAMTLSSTGSAVFSGSVTAGAISGTSLSIDTLSMNGSSIGASGNLTLDVAGDIVLDADGGDILLKDNGTHWASVYTNGTNTYIQNMVNSGDIYLSGKDGSGNGVNALILDMSSAGEAVFNSDIRLFDSKAVRFGTDQDFRISNDGSHTTLQNSTSNQDILFKGNDDGTPITALTLDMSNAGKATFSGIVSSAQGFERGNMFITQNEIDVSSGNLHIDVASSIILDSDAGNVYLRDSGTDVGLLSMANTDLYIRSLVSDRDIIFQGYDGSSNITALTLDMSQAGEADFNSAIKVAGGIVAHQTNRGVFEYASNVFKMRSYGATSGSGSITLSTGGGGNSADTVALTLDSNQNATFAGSVTAGGLKIDGGTLSHASSNASSITISGGSNSTNGMNMSLGGSSGSLSQSVVWKQNSSEKMRIDSSGNLLVGTTDTTLWNDNADNYGHNILSNGQYYSSTNGEINAYLNRQNSDGAILAFAKDGTTVGSIFNSGTTMGVGSLDTGVLLANNIDAILPWNASTNAERDAAIDLGRSIGRFRNLHLSGTANIAGDLMAGNVLSTHGHPNADDFIVGNITGTATGLTIVGASGSSGNIHFSDGTSSGNANIQGQLVYAHNDNSMRFYTAVAERMRIDASGRVNIGNTTNFSAADADDLQVGNTTGAHGISIISSNSHNANIFFGDNNNNDAGSIRYNHTNNRMEFYTDRTQRMVISSTGAATFSSTASILGGEVYLGVEGTASGHINAYESLTFNLDVDNNDTTKAFSFHVNGASGSGTELMRINEAGNVGIGTSAPAALLHVKSAGNGEIEVERTSGALINLQAQAAAGYIGTDSNHLFGLKANGTVRLKIATSGAISFNDAFTFPTSDGSANQLLKTDGSGNMSWVTVSGAGTPSYIADGDGDTKIQVEESSDEDKIRFDTAGVERMIIDASGKVGIGTTSPMSHLHVNKDVAGHNTDGITLGKVEANGWIDANEEMGRLSWAASYGSSFTPAIGAYISAKADANWNGNQAPTRLGFFTAPGSSLTPVERLRITKDGNIGIGTTSPNVIADLHVADTSDARIWLDATSGSTLELYAGSGTSIFNRSNSFLSFGQDNVERMRINTGGNVGIGTTAPSNKLDVNGTIRAQGAITSVLPSSGGTFLSIGHTGNENWSFDAKSGSGSTDYVDFGLAGSTRCMTWQEDGNVGIGTTAPSQRLHIVGNALYMTDGTYGGFLGKGNTVFSGGAANDLALRSQAGLKLGAGGNNIHMSITTAGNVGIGTTAPTHKLHVETTGAKAFFLNRNSGSNAANLNEYSTHHSLSILNRTSGSYLNFGGNSNHTGIQATDSAGSATAKNISLNPYGGNVGIGTTAPLALLHLKSTATGSTPTLIFENTNNAQTMNIDYYSNAGSVQSRISYVEGPGAFSFIPNVSNANSAMYINYAGNVGIGTTTPHQKLVVTDGATPYSSAYNLMQIKKNASNGNDNTSRAGLLIGNNSNAFTIAYGGTTDRLRFINGGNVEQLTLLNGGNVGIGTTAPLSKLNVKGSQGQWRIDPDSVSSEVQALITNTGNSGFVNYRLRTNQLIVDTNGAERMRVDTSGNLLVGKTSSAFGTAGVQASASNGLWSTRSNFPPLALNRLSSDGSIVDFYKDGTTVGSIGSSSGRLYIHNNYGSGAGLRFDNASIRPANSAGASEDNTTDLGASAARFKDLHLSGTANVGGNLVVTGNLTINGTTTTLNTATLNVEDKNIVLNYGSGDTSSTADGAGITIQDAVNGSNDASFTWNAAGDKFISSHPIRAFGGFELPDNNKLIAGDSSDLQVLS